MKLTDENQDYEDCRPLRENTSIVTPPWLQKMLDDHKAKKATTAKAPPSEKPMARE